tara:strand:- start:239 stop:472 length:234 start_codon:yes stop_codon:yes gene_type:complete
VIDMPFFTKEQVDKIRVLRSSIDAIRNRIIEENDNLQEITKEYLGEQYSDKIMAKIINDEFNKELSDKLRRILFGGE